MTTRSPPKRKAAPEGNMRSTVKENLLIIRTSHELELLIHVRQAEQIKMLKTLLTLIYILHGPIYTYLSCCLGCLPTLHILKYTYPHPLSYSVSDMDTTPAPAKKNLRADITRKYDERVAATTEKLDPHRARAQRLLKDVEDGETTSFEGTFQASKEAPKYAAPIAYKDAPLLTLRDLMPGSTGADEEDGDLDQSFRADKIEFLVMSRNCLLYTSPSPRDRQKSRMPSSA